MAQNRPAGSMDLRTTSRIHFQRPDKQPPVYVPENVELKSNTEIKQKNHFGLSYDMLFVHGLNEDASAQQGDRFQSMASSTFKSPDQSIVPNSPPSLKLGKTRDWLGVNTSPLRTGNNQSPSRTSTAMVQFNGRENRPRTRQLQSRVARERRELDSFKTESKASAAHATKIEFKVRAPERGMTTMPSFAKGSAFSGSYVHKYC
mmetsp:Transcript_14317/g.25603  ORF Transcript_14317/g.25603 Transcript_14317/m.25603 type:complete len:203 (-) Transcript_14317:384-992(-)